MVLAGVAFGLGLAFVSFEILLRNQAAKLGDFHGVLYTAVDPVLGWRLAKNFNFTFNGYVSACRDFEVQVSTNSQGFRDVDWQVEKPADTIRIAVIGDSFMEAMQVTREQSPAGILESQFKVLNPGKKVQVMNFGVAGYSLSQFLIIYDNVVKQYKPDYVTVFLAGFHFERTMDPTWTYGLSHPLKVRPMITMNASGELVIHPPEEYEQALKEEQQQIAGKFVSNRTYTVKVGDLPFGTYAKERLIHVMVNLMFRAAKTATLDESLPSSKPVLDLNFKILETLNQHIRENGGKLTIVDADSHFDPTPTGIARAAKVKQKADEMGAGYVDVSVPLAKSGKALTWYCDPHFNPTGYAIVGEALYDAVAQVNPSLAPRVKP